MTRPKDTRSSNWTGNWYVGIGAIPEDKWEDRRKYGFITAGGGHKYVNQLAKLADGDYFYAYRPKKGYVGFGKVTSISMRAAEYRPENETGSLAELLGSSRITVAQIPGENEDYAVGVRWICTFPFAEAKWFEGAFSSRLIVCTLTNVKTLEYLDREFTKPRR